MNMEKVAARSLKKMFAKRIARAKPAKVVRKAAKKKATVRRVQRALTTLRAPARRKQVKRRVAKVGKLGRVASVTQTKNGGLLIQFYKPKQLHFRFPKF